VRRESVGVVIRSMTIFCLPNLMLRFATVSSLYGGASQLTPDEAVAVFEHHNRQPSDLLPFDDYVTQVRPRELHVWNGMTVLLGAARFGPRRNASKRPTLRGASNSAHAAVASLEMHRSAQLR
jgi:hypothetical protein